MSISTAGLEQGLEVLNNISEGEYKTPLLQVVQSPDEYLVFKRIGRLMCVWIKQPFASSFPYNPDLPSNWAKSALFWEIHEPVSPSQIRLHRSQAELLDFFAAEWSRPAEYMGEFNIFYSICKKLRPIVCGKSEVLERAEKVADDLRKQGPEVNLLTLNQVLGVASVSFASYLVHHLSWLSPDHMPIVTGCTLLVTCLGQNKLCESMMSFESTYSERLDRFAGCEFPRCGSIDTRDNQPCGNRVREKGKRCWIHAREP